MFISNFIHFAKKHSTFGFLWKIIIYLTFSILRIPITYKQHNFDSRHIIIATKICGLNITLHILSLIINSMIAHCGTKNAVLNLLAVL